MAEAIECGICLDLLSSKVETIGMNLTLEEGEYKTSFKNPHNGEDIYIIYDPSHMIKLVRNTLGDQGTIFHGQDTIEWEYFINLVDFS